MTMEQNIRAILECHFAGFKEEIIDDVTKRLCEMIDDLGVLKWNDIKEKEPPYHTDILVVDIDGEIYLTHRTESLEYYDSCYGDRIKGIKWWLLLPRQNESEE